MRSKRVLIFIITICILLNCFFIYWQRIQNINAKDATKYIHFSVDDTIEIFKDLTENKDKYETIFDNKTLKFLKECNNLYGAKFSMYCFYEFNGVCLENCTDKFKQDFEENSEWLKFGFHALDNTRDYSKLSEEETQNDYTLVINQLKRIVGENSITTVIRMEKFICNKQNVKALSNTEFGVTGLLGADTIERQDYYLDVSLNEQLFNEDFYYDDSIGISIYNTDIRIENIENIYQEFEKIKEDKEIIAFTHEWILNTQNKNKIKELFELALKNRYTYDFLQNIRGGINEEKKTTN